MTLEDILNSELLNEIVNQEDKDLSECGWNRKEIEEIANFVIKKTK